MASIKLKHTSGNGTILHSPAANPSSDITLKLPSTTGSAGQVLKIASANHSSTNAELEFGADVGGKLLQVVSHVKTGGNFTTTSTSNVDVTGMSKAITPTAASSKIKVTMSFDADIDNSSNNTSVAFFIIDRQVASGSFSEIAGIALGGNSIGTGNFYNSTAIIYLDSPSYSLGDAITYKMKTLLLSSGATISVSQSNVPRTSSIILEEIAA
jgi:hypothetical protein|tara:strand:- start:299 stop:934 length:636 start_codon:yes stop_codon:yes gene_type:complete